MAVGDPHSVVVMLDSPPIRRHTASENQALSHFIMKSRWIVVHRVRGDIEVEIRAWVTRRFCCLSVCSWFKWEDRRRHVSVLLIWRERVALLWTWPKAAATARRPTGKIRPPSSAATAPPPSTLTSMPPRTSGLGLLVNQPQNWRAPLRSRKAPDFSRGSFTSSCRFVSPGKPGGFGGLMAASSGVARRSKDSGPARV